MTAYLAGVQERLREAELARVQAETRAAEERKRRRMTVALAASVLITRGWSAAVGPISHGSTQRVSWRQPKS